MKSRIKVLLCLMLFVPCIFFLSACNARTSLPSNTEWGYIGLTEGVFDLPSLSVSKVEASGKNGSSSLSILWDGATVEDFEKLSNECFTKIPANVVGSTVKTNIEELIYEQDEYYEFNAEYSKNGKDYDCYVLYFTTNYVVNGAAFKANQLAFGVAEIKTGSISSNFWDIDSDDQTWLTESECASLGLEGLELPAGANVLGKIFDEDYLHISLSNTSRDTFDAFAENLFANYGARCDRYGNEKFDSFDDIRIYHEDSDANFGMVIYFSPYYKAGDRIFEIYMIFNQNHTVLYIS